MESFQLVNSWNEDDKYHSNILAMMANGCTIVRTGMVTHSAAAGVCHSSCWLVVGAAVAPRVTGTSTRYPGVHPGTRYLVPSSHMVPVPGTNQYDHSSDPTLTAKGRSMKTRFYFHIM